MSLEAGRRLGPYEVQNSLGAGGMGEVFRARDIRLRRDVALKILPLAFSNDTVRRARFESEARAVAVLNHPNIVAVYDAGVEDGLCYMATELVEGEPLRKFIQNGAQPLRRVIDIGSQIADGLAAAHSAGIVHRDLKPENIMISRDGRVKILDFGLARQTVKAALADATETVAMSSTEPGMILGTVHYMSPEQVRGLPADHRSDIFSLGTILHELVTGKQPFAGETSVETMNAVLKEDAPELPPSAPPALRLTIGRCLEKDPNRRFQSASDLAFALRSVTGATSVLAKPERAAPRRLPRWIVAIVPVIALLALAPIVLTRWSARAVNPARTIRFVLPVPSGDQLVPGAVAISRDGSRIAYAARRSGETHIFLRALDEPDAHMLPNTQEGHFPAFSYKGDALLFFQQQHLKRISLSTGSVAEIGSNIGPRGIDVMPDESVVGIPAFDDAIKLYTPGRETKVLAPPEKFYFHPHVLPGGKVFLYAKTRAQNTADIYARDMDGKVFGPLVENGGRPHYQSGWLLYSSKDAIWGARFDADRLKITGQATALPRKDEAEVSAFDVAGDLLVYVTGQPRLGSRTLLSVDRNGSPGTLAKLQERFFTLAVSPDGKRVALAGFGNDSDVWTYDTERGVASRITFDEGEDETPVWSPDGNKLAFSGSRGGKRVVALRSPDGSGTEQVIWSSDVHSHLTSWSPDGKMILAEIFRQGGHGDIWLVPADGNGKPAPFIVSPFAKNEASFSPNGKYVAYTSNETGQREVYVTAYPGPGGKLQISNMGGRQPVWSRNGRELYYRERNHVMVVAVETGGTVKAGTPRPLFDAPEYSGFGVTPDGRFLAFSEESDRAPSNLHVVLNWQAELKRAAAAGDEFN